MTDKKWCDCPPDTCNGESSIHECRMQNGKTTKDYNFLRDTVLAWLGINMQKLSDEQVSSLQKICGINHDA